MPRVKLNHFHEVSKDMAFPLILLSIFSIFSGFLLKDLFVGLGSFFFQDSIQILPEHFRQVESEFVFYFDTDLPINVLEIIPGLRILNVKHIALIATFVGLSFALFFYRNLTLSNQRSITFNIFNINHL